MAKLLIVDDSTMLRDMLNYTLNEVVIQMLLKQ